MIYRQNNRRTNRFSINHKLIGVVTLVLIILIFGGGVLDKMLGTPLAALAKPVWTARNYFVANTRALSLVITSKQSLWEENLRLRNELASAQAVAQDRAILANDNTTLRVELGLRTTKNSFVVGRVISSPVFSPYDVLVIDLGSETSQTPIKVGDLATYRNGIALGRVASVSGSAAKIVLFSTGGTELPVVIGPERIPAVAHGRGAGNFFIQLPRTLEVPADSAVLVVEPRQDYTIGKIGAINKTPSESLQSLFVRSPLNTSQINYVEVHPN